MAGKKAVVTFHEVWGSLWFRLPYMGWLAKHLHYLFEQLLLRLRFDGFIGVSESTSTNLIAGGVLPQRVHTIYNGIELPKNPTHRPKAYDPDRPFVIGMTARLSSIKDHSTLLRAFALVAKRLPNVRLELAGDGELRQQLESLARELSIVDGVSFLGDVGDIYGAMGHWDLFAYATTEREGLGNAVSEAMALGLPCVVTDVGPMREFQEGGGTIQLVRAQHPSSMADSIISLMYDLLARKRLSLAGHSFAHSRFNSGTFSGKYAAAFGFKSIENKT